MGKYTVMLRFLLLSFLLLVPAGVQAGPVLPCAASGPLTYSPPGSAPAIVVWKGNDLEQWRPPACTGWPAGSPSKLLVTLAGSFRFDGSMSGLLTRVGQISALPNIRYWSATDKNWRPLSNAAFALGSPDQKSRRGDFSAPEMTAGATLYYWEDDSRTGPAVYRLRVLESTPTRAVLASDNVSPVRRYFLTLFKPGALQSTLIIERLSPGLFGVFVATRSGEGASILTSGYEKSYVNRAAALYRQLAGIKTDQEPPAAR
jgi:hypothetical protein